MPNELIPFDQLDRMAASFADSKMFGAKDKSQVMSLLLLAAADGIHPATAMRDFDVINGRPAKKSEAMLRSFIAAGGAVEWHQMDDEVASASFMHPQGSNGKWVKITWDTERARKAGLIGKDNWTKYGRQMRANRVISEGCRRVYPAATSGLYEPGELRDIPQAPEKNMGNLEVLPPESGPPASSPGAPGDSPAGAADGAGPISEEQAMELAGELAKFSNGEARFKKIAKLDDLRKLPAADFGEAILWAKDKQARRA